MIISSGKEIDFIKPDLVPIKMAELKENYENKWQELTVYERAAHLHMEIIT